MKYEELKISGGREKEREGGKKGGREKEGVREGGEGEVEGWVGWVGGHFASTNGRRLSCLGVPFLGVFMLRPFLFRPSNFSVRGLGHV